jgi:hypothetical protein
MDVNSSLTVTSVIFGALFLISEYLGMSKCKANGVGEYIISGMPCFGMERSD